MKWQRLIVTLALLTILRVVPFPDDSGATVVFDGFQLRVYGAVPVAGEADVTWSDCGWFGLWCKRATIRQGGIDYPAVP